MRIRGGQWHIVGLLAAIGCGAASQPETRSSPVRGAIRSLSIVPASRTSCPGEVITARYEATAGEAGRVTLGAADLRSIKRSGTGAVPLTDGSWRLDVGALGTAMTGFRLHASLENDSTVVADTVIAPIYGCDKRTITLSGSTASAFIRLGVLRSPFHDSIVVATFELGNSVSRTIVLGPREMRGGAIRIDARGEPGRAGRPGTQGANGSSCERGARGENGEEGSPGGAGGRVDIIVQTDAAWLANLVSISNQGGPGGAGGAGGAGGRHGGSGGGSGRGSSCVTGQAPNGAPGRQGAPGAPGPTPAVTTIPFPLVWQGSPLWNNAELRRVLEELIELTQR